LWEYFLQYWPFVQCRKRDIETALDFLERTLLLIIGLTFMGGGGVLTRQAFDEAKNVFECIVFGMLVATAGVVFVVWAVGGPPQ